MAGYAPHTDGDIAAMVSFLGLNNVHELFAAVPEALRLVGGLDLPDGRPEPDVMAHIEELEARMARFDELKSNLVYGGSREI